MLERSYRNALSNGGNNDTVNRVPKVGQIATEGFNAFFASLGRVFSPKKSHPHRND